MRPLSQWDEVPIPITREANNSYEEETEEQGNGMPTVMLKNWSQRNSPREN